MFFWGKVALFIYLFLKRVLGSCGTVFFLEKVLFHLGLCEMLGTISLGPECSLELEGPYLLKDWQSGLLRANTFGLGPSVSFKWL